MNKAARAAQVARCIENTGDLFTHDAAAEPFAANILSEQPHPRGVARTIGDQITVTLTCARNVFTLGTPREGTYFRDQSGNRYRLLKTLSHPTQATAVFQCNQAVPAA